MELMKAILKAHDELQFKPTESGIDNARFVIECLSDLDMGKFVGEMRKACDGNPANSENANCAIFDVSGSLPTDEKIKQMALKYRPQQDQLGEFWRDGFRECYLWLSGLLRQ